MTVLPDLLAPGMRVVFCGTAAGTSSARVGAYYARAGNRFWPALLQAGFTPRQLAPREFRELTVWGIGLTDVCKTSHGMDRDIATVDYDTEALGCAMTEYAPGVLAFTSKEAARVAFGLSTTRDLRYGPQQQRIGPTPTWVLPSPSGAGSRHWSIEPWRELAQSLAPPH